MTTSPPSPAQSHDLRKAGLAYRSIVASNIRGEIARSTIDQKSLAERLGVAPSWVTRRVNARGTITVDDLAQISSVLGCTVADLTKVRA